LRDVPGTLLHKLLHFRCGILDRRQHCVFQGFDIFWIGLGVAVDVVQWVGGAWGNRTQIQSTYYERWPRA